MTVNLKIVKMSMIRMIMTLITSFMIISVTATSFLALYLVGKTTSLSGGGEEYELDEVHRALQQHVLLDAHHHPPAAGC